MAKLLGLEDRMNWKDDVQSKEEEQIDADTFKAAFKEFDFSLEEWQAECFGFAFKFSTPASLLALSCIIGSKISIQMPSQADLQWYKDKNQ